MTAIIAWSTFDGHGTASIYLASESRLSQPTGGGRAPRVLRDDFRKTFGSRQTPDIFAVCGTVVALQPLIDELCAAAQEERQARAARAQLNSDHVNYSKDIVTRVTARIPLGRHSGLILFHAYRFGTLDFGLQRIALGLNPAYTRIILEPTKGMLYRDGSGREMVEREQTNDPETDARGFSRWFWQSFVSSLQAPTDPSCGGPPQLVGLYREGNAVPYGVHFKEAVFLDGALLKAPPAQQLEFRDELFQRTLFSGALVDGAQRHARNFPSRNLLP